MNEKTKLLAGKALDTAVSYTWTTLDYEQIHELLACHAELIVRECSEIVLNCGIIGSNNERDFIVSSRKIKHHFEIEE